MSGTHQHDVSRGAPTSARPSGSHGRHGGHDWIMVICCIPMLLIAVALVVTGVVSGSFLLFALVCTALMALMMAAMHGGSGQSSASGEAHRHDQEPAR